MKKEKIHRRRMTQIEFVRIMTAAKEAQKAHQMPMTPA